jgi:transglutaminase-like cysteine proteinase BTLCP
MGSFLSQPLQIVCRDMEEIRSFLSTCRYVSDREQFGVNDYWMRPEDFERVRRGDCDDFALWTWRQLLGLGYSARFVTGSAGRYGTGHAWVSFRVNDRVFIVEPLLARRPKFPRLETLRYRPPVSVEVTGSGVKFFEHKKHVGEPPLRLVAPLVPEWLLFRLRTFQRWLLWPFFALRRRYRRKYTRST